MTTQQEIEKDREIKSLKAETERLKSEALEKDKKIETLEKGLVAFVRLVVPYLPNDITNAIIATILNTNSEEPLEDK